MPGQCVMAAGRSGGNVSLARDAESTAKLAVNKPVAVQFLPVIGAFATSELDPWEAQDEIAVTTRNTTPARTP